MSNTFLTGLTLLLTLATVAVIVSQRAQSSAVISAVTGGIANDINAAVGPVIGSNNPIGGGGSSGSAAAWVG